MMIMEQLNKLLGIKDITTRMISGEDKNIPFSKYDNIFVTTITYISGKIKNEHRYYRDISNSYSRIYEILSKTFDYKISSYSDKYGYYFEKNGFPPINIEVNTIHTDLFRITISYKSDGSFYEVNNFEDIFFSKLESHTHPFNDYKKMKRFLKLKKIEKVI